MSRLTSIIMFVLGMVCVILSIAKWEDISLFLNVCNLIVGLGLMIQSYRNIQKINATRSKK